MSTIHGFRCAPQDVDIANTNDRVLKLKIDGNVLTAWWDGVACSHSAQRWVSMRRR